MPGADGQQHLPNKPHVFFPADVAVVNYLLVAKHLVARGLLVAMHPAVAAELSTSSVPDLLRKMPSSNKESSE